MKIPYRNNLPLVDIKIIGKDSGRGKAMKVAEGRRFGKKRSNNFIIRIL